MGNILRKYDMICIAGQSGAGKSSLAKRLAVELNATIISFGDYIRSITEQQSDKKNRLALQETGNNLIDNVDGTEFVERVLRYYERKKLSKVLVVEGIRHLFVWEAIQKISRKSILIYLHASQNSRIDRIKKRDNLSSIEVSALIGNRMEKNISKLIERAGLFIENDSLDKCAIEVMKYCHSSGFL